MAGDDRTMGRQPERARAPDDSPVSDEAFREAEARAAGGEGSDELMAQADEASAHASDTSAPRRAARTEPA